MCRTLEMFDQFPYIVVAQTGGESHSPGCDNEPASRLLLRRHEALSEIVIHSLFQR